MSNQERKLFETWAITQPNIYTSEDDFKLNADGEYDVFCTRLGYEAWQARANLIPDWQPLETAPKDGKEYLFYRKHDIRTAKWKGDTWGGEGWCYALAVNIANGFTESLPTHWMHLPLPPVSQQHESTKTNDQ